MRWAVVALALGSALAAFGAGALAIVVLALVIGAIWPARAPLAGALLVVPGAIGAVVVGATHSLGYLALALTAAPFAILFGALLAVAGSFAGRAVRRGRPAHS